MLALEFGLVCIQPPFIPRVCDVIELTSGATLLKGVCGRRLVAILEFSQLSEPGRRAVYCTGYGFIIEESSLVRRKALKKCRLR